MSKQWKRKIAASHDRRRKQVLQSMGLKEEKTLNEKKVEQ